MNQQKLLFQGQSISKTRYVLLSGLSLAAAFGLWAFLSYLGLIGPIFLPTPTAVVTAIRTLWTDFGLFTDIWISILRVLVGFGLAVIIAVPLGMYIALNKTLEAVLEPIISFIRYIPPSALLPLFLLWFGIGEVSKVLLICFGVLPYLVFMVYDVVAGMRSELADVAYTLGASNREIVWKIVIPSSLPGIWDAIRVNIGAAWTFVVLAEIIASTTGLGHLIITSQRFIQTANVIGAIAIIGVIGYLTDIFFKVTYKILFPWTEESHART